jgi:PleD family two-component response regulator
VRAVPARILIVDDSKQDQRIHATTLRGQGYDVVTAGNAEEALWLVEGQVPELFLISTHLRGTSGFDLCESLKNDSRFLNVPVIFINDNPSYDDIDRVYSVGGVDYIAKPCHLSEFLAKVRSHIKQYDLLLEVERLKELAVDSSPLTHLPGNNAIVAKIQEAIDNVWDVALIYTDLDNFKAYNDAYGFSAGDDVLLYNADILNNVLRTVCLGDGFLGHIGGDDFVLVVPKDKVDPVGEAIITNFDRGASAFYSELDANRGYIESDDRAGNKVEFPIVSISMGGVLLKDSNFTRYVEVATLCAELKHSAKGVKGSNLFMNRRDAIIPA